MPAVSQAQRGYLNAHFGHDWVKRHHFDNRGKLPKHVKKHKKAAMDLGILSALEGLLKFSAVLPPGLTPTAPMPKLVPPVTAPTPKLVPPVTAPTPKLVPEPGLGGGSGPARAGSGSFLGATGMSDGLPGGITPGQPGRMGLGTNGMIGGTRGTGGEATVAVGEPEAATTSLGAWAT